MEEKLNVFQAELDAQMKEILKLHSEIENKASALKLDIRNEDITNSLAYKVHNLYSAYEDMFKLIAKFFENQIEDMSKYHTDLIKRMRLEIAGIRPNLLSDETFRILDELRGFRHVFRHAYSYELDAERILKLSEKADKLKDVFSKDLKKFREKIMED